MAASKKAESRCYLNPEQSDQVSRYLRYDPETGIVTRIATTSKRESRLIGKPAGWHDRNGYANVSIFSKMVLVHRLAFLLMTGRWPEGEVDHVDGNPSNNKWSNLRIATRSQQLQNTRRRSNNSSGIKGVSYVKTRDKWCAQIVIRGRQTNLGHFKTKEEAAATYAKVAKEVFGDFARTA